VDDKLNDVEVRVLGSLVEKELTTPDYYPMSLNALTNACNQTSNRDPIAHYEESTVARAIETLRVRSLIRVVQQSGSRVSKYRHLMNETLGLVTRQTALLSIMMLRGPQTLGELKTRTGRMAEYESLDEVEAVLEQLINRQPSPLASRLTRRAGQKEVRFAHLLSGEVTFDGTDDPPAREDAAHSRTDRVAALEQSVQELRNEVADLRTQLDAFRRQFE